jgi:chromosome segregation ATPase
MKLTKIYESVKNKYYLKISSNPNIHELKVEDPNLQSQAKEFASLSDQIDSIKNTLKQLENRYKELEDALRPVLEQLQATQDTALEVEDILITIKKSGFDRTSYAYKEAFEWLRDRVNPAMKNIVEEAIEKTKKTARIASTIGVQKQMSENKITDALKLYWNKFISKLGLLNKDLSNAVNDFKERIK